MGAGRLRLREQMVDPFSQSPDPALYVPRDASELALASLQACLRPPGRPAQLVAPPGTGKTLLLHVLASRLPAAMRSVYVPNAGLGPDELCAWTLGQLESPRWPDPIAVLRAFAAHRAECGGALVWLIDDADRLPLETATWLAAPEGGGGPGVRLVLAAADAESPSLAVFRNAARIDSLARPLSPSDLASYVRGRLDRAGADGSLRKRCEAAFAEIQAASGGVPRAVNAACLRLVGTS